MCLRLADVHIVRVRRTFADFTKGFEAEQVHGPFGAAIVHELRLFFAATLREQHNRRAGFLLQVEGQLGANPFLGAVHAFAI